VSEAFQTPWFLMTAVTALGLIVGSFLNVVIYRLPKMMEQGWRQECCEFLDQDAPNDPPLSLSVPNSSCRDCGSRD